MNRVFAIKDRIRDILQNVIIDNPIVVKDIRTRMRGRQAFVIMASYIFFLIIVMGFAYYFTWNIALHNYANPQQAMVNINLGAALFVSLVWTQTILLLLIVPSLTAGAITSELEKKTIELLSLSRLTAGKLIIGKHLSGIMYPTILLTCSLPLSGICIFLGGVSPAEVLTSYLSLEAWGILLAAIGIFMSSLFKRTAIATLLSYVVSGAYFIYLSLNTGIYYVANTGYIPVSLFLNPAVASIVGFLEKIKFYDANICGIFVAIFIHLMISAILLLASTSHVKHFNGNYTAALRIFIIISCVSFIIILNGNDDTLKYVNPFDPSQNLAHILLIIVFTLLTYFAIIIGSGTGSHRPQNSSKLLGLSFKNAFKPDLSGAVAYMIILSVISAIVLILCVKLNIMRNSAYLGMDKIGAKLIYGIVLAGTLQVIAAASMTVMFSMFMSKRLNAGIISIVIYYAVFTANGVLMKYKYLTGNYSFEIQNITIWSFLPFYSVSKESWEIVEWFWVGRGSAWIFSSVIALILALVFMRIAADIGKKYVPPAED